MGGLLHSSLSPVYLSLYVVLVSWVEDAKLPNSVVTGFLTCLISPSLPEGKEHPERSGALAMKEIAIYIYQSSLDYH